MSSAAEWLGVTFFVGLLWQQQQLLPSLHRRIKGQSSSGTVSRPTAVYWQDRNWSCESLLEYDVLKPGSNR